MTTIPGVSAASLIVMLTRKGRRLPVVTANELREDSRREGDEGNAGQEPDVEEEEHLVHPLDLPDQVVVVHPHDPDRDEADRVGHGPRSTVGGRPSRRAGAYFAADDR